MGVVEYYSPIVIGSAQIAVMEIEDLVKICAVGWRRVLTGRGLIITKQVYLGVFLSVGEAQGGVNLCKFSINRYHEWCIFTRLIDLLAMIIPGTKNHFTQIYEIINDAAVAYKGIIPADRWHEPYMTREELQGQIDDGVEFWCFLEGDVVIGVMGIQDKGDVTLIRHAYVRTSQRQKGVGGQLLRHLGTLTTKPILIGTWADAVWAIDFYKKHGFRLVSFQEKEELLRKYWNIPLRQIETSVVLTNEYELI